MSSAPACKWHLSSVPNIVTTTNKLWRLENITWMPKENHCVICLSRCFNGVCRRIQWQKIFVIKRAQTCHLLCKRLGWYHSANKTQVAEGIFKSSPTHASEISQILWIRWISIPCRKNPNKTTQAGEKLEESNASKLPKYLDETNNN